MTWEWWTDEHGDRLVALCREDGIDASEEDIRAAAEGYMDHGADGGGNAWGLVGKVIALEVDRISREHWYGDGHSQ